MFRLLNLMGPISPNAVEPTAAKLREYFRTVEATTAILSEYDSEVAKTFDSYELNYEFVGGGGMLQRQLTVSKVLSGRMDTVDAIHVYGSPTTLGVVPGFVSGFTETVLLTRFNGYNNPSGRYKQLLARGLERFLFESSDVLIFNAKHQMQDMLDNHDREPDESVTVIPPGVNQNWFGPVARSRVTNLRESLGIPSNARIIGACLTPRPIKGITRMIDVLVRVREEGVPAHLIVVGDSEYVSQYRKYADQQGVNEAVTWVGSKHASSLPRWYSLFDVTVMTSELESFGLSITESYLCGTPAVAFEKGGMADQIRHGETGYLVEPYDTTAFASAVVRLLQDAQQRHTFGTAGREFVESEFSLGRAAEEYAHIIDKFRGKYA